MRDQEIINLYPTLRDAYREAIHQFPDHRFSIKQVREREPILMMGGIYSDVL